MAFTVDDRTEYQLDYYLDTADIYKVGRTVGATTGKPGEETVTLVGTYPCAYIYTNNFDSKTSAGRMKEGTLLTIDHIQFTQTTPVGPNCYVVNRSILEGKRGPLYGECHRFQGASHINPSRGERTANALKAMVQTITKRPAGIPA